MPRSVAAGICARPEVKNRPVPEGCEVLRKGFQVAESGRFAVFYGGRAVRSVLLAGAFGRVLKNVRLSAAAARRLRCRRCRLRCCLRCRRCRVAAVTVACRIVVRWLSWRAAAGCGVRGRT